MIGLTSYVLQILASSANSSANDPSKSGNLLTYKGKSRESKVVSWDTPLLTGFYSHSVPLTLTLCLRLHKKFPIRSCTAHVIPKLESF